MEPLERIVGRERPRVHRHLRQHVVLFRYQEMKLAALLLILAGCLSAQSKDWAGLNRYGSDNTELPAPKPGENRVVFLGDQITEKWSPFFPGKPYLNRGIADQTSAQMLVRFRQDVIALKPKVVVINAGLNDITGQFGPGTEAVIAENITSMVELAKVNGIRVVLASVTPVCDCTVSQTFRRPPGKLLGLNRWLKSYAAQTGSVYLDYFTAMAEGRNMKKELTTDGLMPNPA